MSGRDPLLPTVSSRCVQLAQMSSANLDWIGIFVKQLNRFAKVPLGLHDGLALADDIEFRAASDVPVVVATHDNGQDFDHCGLLLGRIIRQPSKKKIRTHSCVVYEFRLDIHSPRLVSLPALMWSTTRFIESSGDLPYVALSAFVFM